MLTDEQKTKILKILYSQVYFTMHCVLHASRAYTGKELAKNEPESRELIEQGLIAKREPGNDKSFFVVTPNGINLLRSMEMHNVAPTLEGMRSALIVAIRDLIGFHCEFPKISMHETIIDRLSSIYLGAGGTQAELHEHFPEYFP